MTDPTITVDTSPLPEQLWLGLRTVGPAVVSFLLGRKLLASDLADMCGVLGGVLFPVIYGQIVAFDRSRKLAKLACDPTVPQVQPK